MDEQQALAAFFPDRYIALVIPLFFMVLLITVVVSFIGCVFINEG